MVLQDRPRLVQRLQESAVGHGRGVGPVPHSQSHAASTAAARPGGGLAPEGPRVAVPPLGRRRSRERHVGGAAQLLLEGAVDGAADGGEEERADEEAGEGGKREGERQDLERKDAYPSQQSGRV